MIRTIMKRFHYIENIKILRELNVDVHIEDECTINYVRDNKAYMPKYMLN